MDRAKIFESDYMVTHWENVLRNVLGWSDSSVRAFVERYRDKLEKDDPWLRHQEPEWLLEHLFIEGIDPFKVPRSCLSAISGFLIENRKAIGLGDPTSCREIRKRVSDLVETQCGQWPVFTQQNDSR